MAGALTLLLWDVDHTLIENGGVSKENYALAFELLTGRVPLVRPRTDGRTDMAIMGDLLVANGVDEGSIPWERQFEALVRAGARNGSRLVERGFALPGAVECLARVASLPDVVQSVLTGNVVENARVKLGAFGLDGWVDFTVGGFGGDDRVRGRLVPVAQARAAAVYGFDPLVGVTVLVGDTTLDVHAALTGGARVVAVATGADSTADLVSAGADVVIDGLGDVDVFVAALDEVRSLGPVGPRVQVPGS